MVENKSLENTPYPICPWCEEEMDVENFDFSYSESMMDTVRCENCGKPVEVKVSYVYSTSIGDEEDIIEKEDSLHPEDGYEEELDPYDAED